MSHRLALDPPSEDLVLVTRKLADATLAYARTSPRQRVIQPFHKTEADALHRFLNAVQPGSYVRPHRHIDPPKAEAWIILRGRAAFFTFEDDGRVRASVEIAPDAEVFGVDLVPGVWHTFFALEPDTLIYEVKTGPYVRASDKAFAPWAPAEGSPEADAYMRTLLEGFSRSAATR